MPRIWLAMVLFWLCGPAWALLPATLDSADLRLSLGPSMAYLEDSKGMLSAEQVGALESVGGMGGKGSTLAEGQLYSGNPLQVKKDLERIAALTPSDVKAAMQRWLDSSAQRRLSTDLQQLQQQTLMQLKPGPDDAVDTGH